MIGMGIARSLDERGQVGATHMGTGFDAWYPATRLHADAAEHQLVLDRDRPVSVRHAALLHIADFPPHIAR